MKRKWLYNAAVTPLVVLRASCILLLFVVGYLGFMLGAGTAHVSAIVARAIPGWRR